jgi:hypothetical protein
LYRSDTLKEASMSTLKTTLFVSALVIAAAVVFFVSGADQLIASSSNSSACSAVAGDNDKTASSCDKSSCTKTAAAACPASAAKAGADCAKSCSKSSCTGKKTGSSASLAPIPDREGTRIVLTGRYVCGYCDLGLSETCQAGFRTADGKNYLLVTNNLSKELKQAARSTDVEIVTRVQKYGGVKYLEVDIVRPL